MADQEQRKWSAYPQTSTLVPGDFFPLLHAGLNQLITFADLTKQLFTKTFTNDTDFTIDADATAIGDRTLTFKLNGTKLVRLKWDNANNRFFMQDQDGLPVGLYYRDLARVGTVVEYYGTALPFGALWANGALASRTTYKDLFQVYGTRYGAGDGSTTFGLPNKMGTTGVGVEGMGGAAPSGRISASWAQTLGGRGGAENHTLTVDQLPAHTHDTQVFSSSGVGIASNGSSNGNLPTTTGSTGGGQPHNNVQPSMACNYIIWY